jgi:tRNA modification GTPase
MNARRPSPPSADADAGRAAPSRLAAARRDTIVALATPPGRGALALIRLSGGDAVRIAGRIVTPLHGSWPPAARRVTRVTLHAPDDPTHRLDDALTVHFAAPHSATGEDVVEFTTHGGVAVPDAVCAALVTAGARPAAPGEFTARAVLHGRLDLLRAEAIGDLIDARSGAEHRTALAHLDGALAQRFGALRDDVIALEALLAYDIDFPAEDEGRLAPARATAACDRILADLDALLATLPQARLGRDGATVVLAGAPNAGKSALLNALVGEARVLVSETPGTTRDAIEVLLDADPLPLRLVDTAGLRESSDAVEQAGIAMSQRYLASAHVVVACADDDTALAATRAALAELSPAPLLAVRTKLDLVPSGYQIAAGTIGVSALRGEGLAALRTAITDAVTALAGTAGAPGAPPVVTRARHHAALGRAREEIALFRAAWQAGGLPAPVAAVHVRAARESLDELIGSIDVDEVFARVFSTFCIGK